MSIMMHINWDQSSISEWEKTRLKGKRDYIIRNGFHVFIPAVIGLLILGFILGIVQGRLNEPEFWIWLVSYGFIAFIATFSSVGWKWDETEKQYLEYLKTRKC